MAEITITDEFKRALELFNSSAPEHQVIYLTGYAGTGKSTLLRHFRNHASNGKKGIVLAPTGVAAYNVGGQTIHSFFNLPLRCLYPEEKGLKTTRMSEKNAELVHVIDYIVIDEISMVRPDILDAVDFRIRQATGNPFPFGGKKVILVGDLFQLEPIINEKDEFQKKLFTQVYPSHYFFSAQVLDKAPLSMVELTHVFRQENDLEFMEILSCFRMGQDWCDNQVDKDFVDSLQKFNSRKGPVDPEAISLVTTNALADKLNAQGLADLPGEVTIFNAYHTENFNMKDAPAPAQLELKVGARVMLVWNSRDQGLFNGQMGTVTAIKGAEDDKGTVEVLFEGQHSPIIIGYNTWENSKYQLTESGDVEAVADSAYMFTQLPLRLGYAVTVHKSQGLTFDRVNLNFGYGAFAHGQLYVAASRCRSLAGVTLQSKITRSDSIVDSRVVEFFDKHLKKAQPTV